MGSIGNFLISEWIRIYQNIDKADEVINECEIKYFKIMVLWRKYNGGIREETL